MFDIWDVHGRAIPYTQRPPKPNSALPPAGPVAAPRPEERGESHAFRAVAAYQATQKKDSVSRPTPRAEDWMSRPVVTVQSGTPLVDAWTLFRARQFRQIPVVEPDDPAGLRPPIGMLSDRDLLLFFADHGSIHGELPSTPVDDVMQTDVLTARPGTSIHRVAHVMVREGLGAMPIVDPEDGLIGILTRGDIMRLAVELTATDLAPL